MDPHSTLWLATRWSDAAAHWSDSYLFWQKPVLTSSLSDCQLWMLGDEDTSIEIVYGEEKNILYWADQSSRGIKKISCTGTTSPTNQTKKDPLHLYSISPHFPQFLLVSLVDTSTVARFANGSFSKWIATILSGNSLAFCTIQNYYFHIVSNAEHL